MARAVRKSMWLVLLATLTGSAWAAQSPIGMLKVQGSATITTPVSTFTLKNQEYAYFSGDQIKTSKGAEAVVSLSDGLNVTFVGQAQGGVSQQKGTYNIELQQGYILVKADKGINYQILHNGKPVSPDQALSASDAPFVVSVASTGEVQFYMPAQLDQGQESKKKKAAAGLKGSLQRAGVSPGQIAAILGALVGAGTLILTSDKGPSS